MKYRAITMAVIQDHGKPLQSFSDSMEVIDSWAHTVSRKHGVDVKVFETYERVLAIVKKPYVPAPAPDDIQTPHECRVCGHTPPCPFHSNNGVKRA